MRGEGREPDLLQRMPSKEFCRAKLLSLLSVQVQLVRFEDPIAPPASVRV